MLDPDHLVKDVATLVSLPEVVLRVNALVDERKASADEIGEAIAQDAALTAKLPRLANSAMFGRSRKLDTVGRALAVLGTRQVRDLSLGLVAARAAGRRAASSPASCTTSASSCCSASSPRRARPRC